MIDTAKEEKLTLILNQYKNSGININDSIQNIMKIFGIDYRIILIQDWTDDISNGWFKLNGEPFNEISYQIDEIIERDDTNKIIKAYFKYFV